MKVLVACEQSGNPVVFVRPAWVAENLTYRHPAEELVVDIIDRKLAGSV